ncbi:endonuclease domain-containing 1 protein-like [Denticeps clupeoides]|uniref:Endonuclease domain-containing 1 protein-like n=1 Tax=Denticeps clupeoides TaxID=299321 RepID=A0AAY3ZTQ4_9TELE|nr:endonuclease domain-containing 1 protein-like [Denticeps clupeoides]
MIYLHFVGLAVLLTVCFGDVGDFSPCKSFFYQSTPPVGINGTPICQRYKNMFRFATLYDRQRRSPWFSAYIFSDATNEKAKTKVSWMYEPQLANGSADGNMIPFPNATMEQNVVENQAVQQDYKNSSFSRGHLNPSQHHRDQQDRDATFTLTNIVPQRAEFNNGPWNVLEDTVKKRLIKYCKGPAYIITGIIPYKTERWIKNRVAIPEYLWSAYCCPDYSSNESISNKFPTFAAIGCNDNQTTIEMDNGTVSNSQKVYNVKPIPLDKLEEHLIERFGTEVRLFKNQCSTAVDEAASNSSLVVIIGIIVITAIIIIVVVSVIAFKKKKADYHVV